MSEFRADLHCHSCCSDGTLSPVELVELAVSMGLGALSITDHDTIAAYQMALPRAKELGLDLISGAEFSTMHRGKGVHILAYGFSFPSPLLEQFCQRHQRRRTARNQEILYRLERLGLPVDASLLESARHTVGRPHIAQAMVERGYVADIQEAFTRYIGGGQPAYAAGEAIGVLETINLIHEAGGVAILAHPMLIRQGTVERELFQMPFDGLEGYYARMPAHIEARWRRKASERGWIVTGGSDFHGEAKPHLTLGASWIDRKRFDQLVAKWR